ncbi:MAG: PA14 domain-containing protein [Candidatus Brocadiia bacterium]
MIFNNPLMLIGLAGLLVPILIHLLNRSRARVLDWGAMRFLLASLTSQNRRLLIEEIILLALRCLLVALVVMAMAKPFLPTRTSIPWAIVLPAMLAAVICLGVAAAMWRHRLARWALLGVAILLGASAGTASAIERWVQEMEWASGGGELDIAVLVDASTSMQVAVEGKTNFARALEEARAVVDACRPGDAVSLILAGPVPRPAVPTPTADRQELATALEQAQPIGGAMNVLEGLNAAAASLAEGHNAAKKIVLITDGQNVGWDVHNDARWQFLAEGLADLPTAPEIICRRLPLPRSFRNAAVADISFSRKVVGTDRPVTIRVKVMNTGTVPIKPAAVELTAGGQRLPPQKVVTEVLPQAAETVRFEHRFDQPGPNVVTGRVVFRDDLAADNAASRVLSIVRELPVLVVDGAPSSRPLGGAAAFIEIGLTPRSEDEEEEPAPAEPRPGAPPRGEDYEVRFLVEPRVTPAPDILAQAGQLDRYAAVILANVPRLPGAMAERLASYVERGGGLLIAPGEKVEPTFYDAWRTAAGRPMSPAKLAERRIADQEPARPEPRSFSHPALQVLADAKRADIAAALIKSYWTLAVPGQDPDVRVGARLHTGEPFLVERKLGQGYVLMTAMALDPRASNLPGLKSFVPLLHETVYYLAEPGMADDNLTAGSQWTYSPSGRRTAAAAGTGLLGQYYDSADFTNRKLTRVDPTIDFEWGDDRPHAAIGRDTFSVRWTGAVGPRFAERYTFSVVVDDGARLWVDGRLLVDAWREQNPTEYSAAIPLQADRKYPIKMEYYDSTGGAVARLLWKSPSQPREVVPQSQLFPEAPREAEPARQTDRVAQVVTPSGRRLAASLVTENGERRVVFDQTHEPGLYTLLLAAEEDSEGQGEAASVPFVVLADVEESVLVGLTEADMDLPAQHVSLFQTERTDELTSKVAGSVPGDELWKYLVITALLAAVGEIAVSRWVAVQRRLHAPQTVSFAAPGEDVQTFRDRARELLATPSQTEQTVSNA